MEKSYTLLHPIEMKNKEGEVVSKIEAITLKPLLGEHARKITATAPMAILIDMIGLSAGLPPSTMNKMHFDDIMAAAEVGEDFFGGKGLMGRLSP